MNGRDGTALVVAIMIGSPLGLFMASFILGDSMRENDFVAGVIMLGCMAAVWWLIYKILGDYERK